MVEQLVWAVIPKDVRQAPYTVEEETLIEDAELREITRLVPKRVYDDWHNYAEKLLSVRREMLDNYGRPELHISASLRRG